jgi:site-specific recombinase XerD
MNEGDEMKRTSAVYRLENSAGEDPFYTRDGTAKSKHCPQVNVKGLYSFANPRKIPLTGGIFLNASEKLLNSIETTLTKRGTALSPEARTAITAVKGVYPHILRHSFAQHARDSGMDITILQSLLGHESVNTTQIYAKTSLAAIKAAHDKIVF